MSIRYTKSPEPVLGGDVIRVDRGGYGGPKRPTSIGTHERDPRIELLETLQNILLQPYHVLHNYLLRKRG